MAKCPYCDSKLIKEPKRKTKCPDCDEVILVRNKKPVTEDEAAKTDWMKRLDGLGFSQRDYNREHKKLSKRFGFKASVNDTVWALLNSGISNNAFNLHNQKILYWEMARMVRMEGKDATPYLKESHRVALQEMKNSGDVEFVEIRLYGVGDSSDCEYCISRNNEKIAIEIALRDLPLPHGGCTSEHGCRCEFWPINKAILDMEF